MLHFHRAVCDGLGISQFIHDFMLFYSQQQGMSFRRRALRKYETSRLAQRGTLGLTWGKLLRMAPKQAVGLLGVRQFLMRKPVPLVRHERELPESPIANPFPAACSHRFTCAESERLRQFAKASGVTTNDLLCRDLFLAMDDFRRQEGAGDESQWLRLMIPVNLRSSGDRRLPAANVVGLIFLDRRGMQMAQPEQLLDSVRDEMQLIKENELGYTFVFSLHLNRLLPGGLRRAARGRQCNAWAVFTNLGRLVSFTGLPDIDGEVVCGDVRLVDLEVLPPLAPYMCVAFGAGWYAGRLSMSLRYDPRVLDSLQAAALLAAFVARVRETCAVDSSGHNGSASFRSN